MVENGFPPSELAEMSLDDLQFWLRARIARDREIERSIKDSQRK